MWCRRVVLALVATTVAFVAAGCGGSGGAAATDGSGTPAGVSPGSGTPSSDAGAATVVRVVDGDTLVVQLGGEDERVRLIGIDTPETKKPDSPVECFGPEASAHLGDLLPPGTAVRLERDAELRDRYDRLLAYVYTRSDDAFVNLAMARDGYAGQLTVPPNVAHVDEFTAAVRDAREGRRGLWQSCSGPHQTAGGSG